MTEDQVTEDHGTAPPTTDLRCTFLDVGHGTSVIIEMPTGEVWLYDAGHMGAAERSHQEIASPHCGMCQRRGSSKLLISHADTDHYNATRGLSKRFKIDSLASPTQFWNSTDRDVQALLTELGDSINRQSYHAGLSGSCGAVQYQVLHPQADVSSENDNAASLCLLVEYAGKRILLPGDLEGVGCWHWFADFRRDPAMCSWHIIMAVSRSTPVICSPGADRSGPSSWRPQQRALKCFNNTPASIRSWPSPFATGPFKYASIAKGGFPLGIGRQANGRGWRKVRQFVVDTSAAISAQRTASGAPGFARPLNMNPVTTHSLAQSS